MRQEPLYRVQQLTRAALSLDQDRVHAIACARGNQRIASQHEKRNLGQKHPKIVRNVFAGDPLCQMVVKKYQIENFLSRGAQAAGGVRHRDDLTAKLLQEHLSNP